MTTGLKRYLAWVLTALCLVVLAVLTASCEKAQPPATPEVPVYPTASSEIHISPNPPTATPETPVYPTATPEFHASSDTPTATPVIYEYPNVTWFVPASLEEQIYYALRSDSLIIVRASLQSVTAGAEPDKGASAPYRAVHKLRFTVHEYLEGSGPNEILVVVRGDRTHTTEAAALAEAESNKSTRNASWDNRQAVLFVGLATPSASESDASSPRKASFATLGNPEESAWDYTVDTLSRAWLPALTAGGATGRASNPDFVTDGAVSPPPTISLSNLKAKIAGLTAELKAGEGIAGFHECISGRILRERIDRADPLGPLPESKSLASGLKAGAEIFSMENNHGDPTYSRLWLKGPDAELFEAVTIDDDKVPSNGYNLGFSTARPLPAGSYSVHDLLQHYSDMPCNFKPDNIYGDWTVTVTAPTGTLHELFFDPVTVGSAVAADATNGTLKPTAFTGAGGASATIGRIAYESGQVKIKVTPVTALASQVLDVIELDGAGSLSLSVANATVDAANNTLSWAVSSQPWEDGDTLMVRIHDGAASAPTPAAQG